jgi:hypothetical protein
VLLYYLFRANKLQDAAQLSIIKADPILKDVAKKDTFKNTEVPENTAQC